MKRITTILSTTRAVQQHTTSPPTTYHQPLISQHQKISASNPSTKSPHSYIPTTARSNQPRRGTTGKHLHRSIQTAQYRHPYSETICSARCNPQPPSFAPNPRSLKVVESSLISKSDSSPGAYARDDDVKEREDGRWLRHSLTWHRDLGEEIGTGTREIQIDGLDGEEVKSVPLMRKSY
jgi:hypothetical protein